MVACVIVTTVIPAESLHRLVTDVDERLRGGDHAVDLIKPVHYPTLPLADQLGRSASQLAFVVAPMVAIAALAFATYSPATLLLVKDGQLFPGWVSWLTPLVWIDRYHGAGG